MVPITDASRAGWSLIEEIIDQGLRQQLYECSGHGQYGITGYPCQSELLGNGRIDQLFGACAWQFVEPFGNNGCQISGHDMKGQLEN